MGKRKFRLTACEKATHFYNKGLRFVSSKWFYKNSEIYNVNRYLIATSMFDDVNDVQKTKDAFIAAYGEFGNWPDLPIVNEARNITELKPLVYPLNKKQLVIINYLLRHDEEVFFILTGVGGSGKSTFANIICQIFDNDCASLNLSELSNDFMLASGASKRLIYSDELNSDEINGGKLKQLFSNQMVTVNPKFEKPYQTRFQSAFFFNCNIPPRLDLCDTGMMRRILYFEMNTKIANPDPTLNKKVFTHEDLVNIVAWALRVDMSDWRKLFEKETRYYLVKNNSVYIYREIDNYAVYNECCKNDGLKPFAKPKWEAIRLLLHEWGYIDEQN